MGLYFINIGNEGIWEVLKLFLFFNYKFFFKKIILINKKSIIVKLCEEIWVIVKELEKDDKNYFYNMILCFDLIVVKRDNNEWENFD